MLKIKELREKKGLKQKELACLLSIPSNTLNQYENHKREPDHEILFKFADFFQVSLDELLGRTQPLSKQPEISLEDIELLQQIKKASADKQKAIELILNIEEKSVASSK